MLACSKFKVHLKGGGGEIRGSAYSSTVVQQRLPWGPAKLKRAKKFNFEDKIFKKNPQILILLLGQSNGQVSFSTGVAVNL